MVLETVRPAERGIRKNPFWEGGRLLLRESGTTRENNGNGNQEQLQKTD